MTIKGKTAKQDNKKTVVSWAIQVEWSDGTVENLNDLPNGVAHEVDEFLTELENAKSQIQTQ